MKVLVLSLALFFVLCTVSWAVLDDNSTNQNQGQLQGQAQVQGQSQGQISINSNDTSSRSSSYSDSTAIAVQGQNISDKNKQSVTVNGDESKTTAIAFGATPATKGVDSATFGTPWGGGGLSEDSENAMCIDRINALVTMYKSGLVDLSFAQPEVIQTYEQLKEASKPKRLCGYGYKTNGRNLSNLFGILSWRSFKNE